MCASLNRWFGFALNIWFCCNSPHVCIVLYHQLYYLYSVVPLPGYATPNPADPYRGQGDLATIATKFSIHLFGCPDYYARALTNRLPFFIAHALHLHETTPSRHLRCSCSPSALKGSLSNPTRPIRPPSIYYCVHGFFQGHV